MDILNEEQIAHLLRKIAGEIAADSDSRKSIALIGIRSGGEILAQRLARILKEQHQITADCGALDITLYRDDINQMGSSGQPTVRATEIDFGVDNRVVVLVDDVMQTGRSIRSALDALTALGRPRVIRLAVLVDRGHREIPIQPDFTGTKFDAPTTRKIILQLKETQGRDEVILE